MRFPIPLKNYVSHYLYSVDKALLNDAGDEENCGREDEGDRGHGALLALFVIVGSFRLQKVNKKVGQTLAAGIEKGEQVTEAMKKTMGKHH
jgi:hypothetical protein